MAALLFHSTFDIRHSTLAAQTAFTPALPGYDFSFPRDHGTHDEYKTEWWYYTGHLETDSGKRYGFELTFFRVGITPPGEAPKTRWDLRNLALAHFAVTDVAANDFRYYEKLNRSSPFTAGAAVGTLDVFNEGWRAMTLADGSWRLMAYGGKDSIDLKMTSHKAPAIHGENGISVKGEGIGNASHYYSMTRLEVRGRVNGANCHGQAWMDHEFGSSALRESQQGWDWFSIQLDNDAELMLYQIRRNDGTPDTPSSGSLITDGNVIHLRREQMIITPLGKWHSNKSDGTYPMGWRVAIPSLGISLTLHPLMKDQELVTRSSTQITYWEGAVDIAGSFSNVAVSGKGYVEMTGYARPFRSP
ncbi:MAG TPA: lipocalin-like domain-containing protein [Thermoanaerobaculia bacterium]|jgi:predicted secreted hydrolase|nr:lipocalin-like domain-containing protein [Thermoanaerobaculia bacterium]